MSPSRVSTDNILAFAEKIGTCFFTRGTSPSVLGRKKHLIILTIILKWSRKPSGSEKNQGCALIEIECYGFSHLCYFSGSSLPATAKIPSCSTQFTLISHDHKSPHKSAPSHTCKVCSFGFWMRKKGGFWKDR